MAKTWLDFIKADQLPEDYQIMVGAIGLENTIKLAHALPSVYIYLASPDRLFKAAKVQYVRDCYNNASQEKPFNHRRVALETRLSIREVYDILAARMEEVQQVGLFDDA